MKLFPHSAKDRRATLPSQLLSMKDPGKARGEARTIIHLAQCICRCLGVYKRPKVAAEQVLALCGLVFRTEPID